MNIPTTMRALRQTSLEGPRDMRLITDAPAPAPGRGEVVAMGEAVTGPRPGTLVVGIGDGAFAEYMVLPSAASPPGRPCSSTPRRAQPARRR